MAAGLSTTQTAIKDQTTGNLAGVSNARLKVNASDGGVQELVDGNKLYSFAVRVNMTTANIDNPIILLRNPNGSGKVVYFWLMDGGSETTNTEVEFGVYSTPTVTVNGTAITVGSRNIGGGASAAVLLPTSLPTVSAAGTFIDGTVHGQNASSSKFALNASLAIQPNNAALITGNPSANGRVAFITVIWAEL